MSCKNLTKIDWRYNRVGECYDYGLWENNNRIAIYWPQFSKIFLNSREIDYEDFDKFYIQYDNENPKQMTLSFYHKKNLTFTDRSWYGIYKAKIFTLIEY